MDSMRNRIKNKCKEKRRGRKKGPTGDENDSVIMVARSLPFPVSYSLHKHYSNNINDAAAGHPGSTAAFPMPK